MTKTFLVTIEYKRGQKVAPDTTIEWAVAMTDPTCESYKGVRVEEVGNIKTRTKDDIVGEMGDMHDFVLLKVGKTDKEGGFVIYTDEGRDEITLDNLKEEFGVLAYLGNDVYQIG